MSEEQTTVTVQQEPTAQDFAVRTADMEKARREQWKAAIQQELQELVQQAAGVRKKINEAKTQYKKDFYNKKFVKVQGKVMQMVAALRQMDIQEQTQPATPHVHDENCQHDHEETHDDETSPTEAS